MQSKQKLFYLIGSAVLVMIVLLSIATFSLAQSGTWTTKSNMITLRMACSSSEVNGIIYVIGGSEYPHFSLRGLSTNEAYDPATDSWTTKSDMPTPRVHHSTCALNGKIYVFGGAQGWENPLALVEEYDPINDTWTKKEDMPTPRLLASACAIDEKIYVIGGARTVWDSYMPLKTVERYDPIFNTWLSREDMPQDMPELRVCHSSSVFKKKIYVFGGSKTGNPFTIVKPVLEYDPFAPSSVESNSLYQQNTAEFRLHQNYPNPFNSSTTIIYSIPEPGVAILKIYDLIGREIQMLVNKFVDAGTHSVTFDASNLPSGMYIYKLQAGDFREAGKMLLMR